MAPAPPRPCDFCRNPVAPRGYAPPEPIKVRRPIWTCTDPACMAQGEARRQAAIDRAAGFGSVAADPAPAPARPDGPQGSLF